MQASHVQHAGSMQYIFFKKLTPEKAKGEQIPCSYSHAWIILIALSEI